MNESLAIISTGATVGAVIVAGGRWALRSSLAEYTRPLSDSVQSLTHEMRTLTAALSEEKATSAKSAGELREILNDLNKIVADHETRLRLVEQKLEPPPPRPARLRRAS